MEPDIILEREIKGQRLFVGHFEHSMDSKKRVTIPSEWREQVGSPKSLYVVPDMQERCLIVLPSSELLFRVERLRARSIADSDARRFARILASQSDLVAWDGQGRIRIKDHLLAYAGIEEQVIFVGALDKFELWSPVMWEKAGGSMGQDLLAKAATEIGF